MEHLSNHHRSTLREIFDHQSSGTIEWRKVRSLLAAVGTVEEEHDGKLRVTVGPETEVLHVPTTRRSIGRPSSTCAGC
jgi:hypothetical protein